MTAYIHKHFLTFCLFAMIPGSIRAQYVPDDSSKAAVFATTGFFAGAVELFVIRPVWNRFASKAERTLESQNEISVVSIAEGLPAAFVTSQLSVRRARDELEFSRSLKNQAAGGSILLTGIGAMFLLLPEETLRPAWRHPAMLAFTAAALVLSIRFADSYRRFLTEEDRLREEKLLPFFYTASYPSRDAAFASLSYYIQKNQTTALSQDRRSESGLICLEYLIAAGAGAHAYFFGNGPESPSRESSSRDSVKVAPLFAVSPKDIRAGLSFQF